MILKGLLPSQSELDKNIPLILKPQVFVPEKFPDSDEAPDFEPAVH